MMGEGKCDATGILDVRRDIDRFRCQNVSLSEQ